jgi:hypothetical protein
VASGIRAGAQVVSVNGEGEGAERFSLTVENDPVLKALVEEHTVVEVIVRPVRQSFLSRVLLAFQPQHDVMAAA